MAFASLKWELYEFYRSYHYGPNVAQYIYERRKMLHHVDGNNANSAEDNGNWLLNAGSGASGEWWYTS